MAIVSKPLETKKINIMLKELICPVEIQVSKAKISDLHPFLQVIEYQNKLNINNSAERKKAIRILINSIYNN